MNWSALELVLVPPVPVTVTSMGPPHCAGLIAVICVSELTVKDAFTEPKLTAAAPVKPVPVIVTLVPPAVGPLLGLTLVIVGAAGGGVLLPIVRPAAKVAQAQPLVAVSTLLAANSPATQTFDGLSASSAAPE